MKWSPDILGGLFCDKRDYKGMYYWFDVCKKKIEDRAKFKELLLKGLGYKISQ